MRSRVLTAGAISAAAAYALPALAPVAPRVAGALNLPLRSPGAGVLLTFDDGPHPEGTIAVLETLRGARVPATFFLVGEQVEAFPRLAGEIAAEGHEIALHCHRHRNLLRLTPGQVADDLDRAADAIHDATGHEPALHRPPYGIYSWSAIGIARRRGWRPLLWSRWGRDWSGAATPESVTRLVTRDLGAGDVLLLHDADWYSAPGSWRTTARALPRVLEHLAARGLDPQVARSTGA